MTAGEGATMGDYRGGGGVEPWVQAGVYEARGEKKLGFWAESFFLMQFLPPTKFCQAPNPSTWA